MRLLVSFAAWAILSVEAGHGAQEPGGTVSLNTWYSPTRGDYFTTTQSAWRGRERGDSGPGPGGYRFERLEGFVFSSDRPRPRGTVPLYHWWSESRQDNFLTTDPAWAGRVGDVRPGQGDYRLFRIEGYVYESLRDGTVPLHSFWHSRRQDNAVSTLSALSGYELFRTAGYVLPPPSVDGVDPPGPRPPRPGGPDPLDPEVIDRLGPGIHLFERIPDCNLPDPSARVLRYRISPSPAGHEVARIRIDRLNTTTDGRTAIGTAFDSPERSGAAVRLEHDGVLDPGALELTVGYRISATDVRGTTSNRFLDTGFYSRSPTFHIIDNPRALERRDDLTSSPSFRFHYQIGMRISGISVLSYRARLQTRDGRELPAGAWNMIRSPADGWDTERTDRLPTPYVPSWESRGVALRFSTNETLAPREGGVESWRLDVDLTPDSGGACGNPLPGVTASLSTTARASRGSTTSTAPREATPAYDGYPYHVWCVCTNDYVTEESRWRACLANPRGADAMCQFIRPWLAATSCRASRSARLDDGPPSCRATSLSYRPDPE